MREYAVATWSDRIHKFMPVENVVMHFCNVHGYHRILSNKRMLPDLPKPWEKIKLLITVLQNYYSVFYLDDDAVVNRLDYTLEYFMSRFPSYDIILSATEKNGFKWQGSPNTGTFIIKNTSYSINLLKNVLNNPLCDYRYTKKCCWEQDCVWQLFTNKTSLWDKFVFTDKHVKIIPAAWFACNGNVNAFTSRFSHEKCLNPFVYHEMGMPKGKWIRQKASLLLNSSVTHRENQFLAREN